MSRVINPKKSPLKTMNGAVRKITPTEDAVLRSATHELPNQTSVRQTDTPTTGK